MSAIVHYLLLRLPPEFAHHCGIRLLRLKQWLLFRCLRKKLPTGKSIHVSAVPRLTFRTRLGLAAGFDKNAEVFAVLSTLGFGFIEVGTVTPLPQSGNPKPRIWRLGGQGLRNQLGFNNVGLDAFYQNILRYRAFVWGIPIFANIGKGKDTPLDKAINDYAVNADALKEVVDGFVINVSSPNTAGLRDLQNENFLEQLAAILPKGIPTLLKLAPDLEDAEIEKLATQIGENDRFAGLVLTNTSRQLAQDLAGADTGGYSGPALFERSLKCVALARPHLKEKLLVGVGGVSSVERAKTMREAGADLVEVYTSFIYRGPRYVRELSEQLTD